MRRLLLEARERSGPLKWRWLLTDEATGQPLADHQVALDPDSAQFEAFTDLYRYSWAQAIPDRRAASEAKIMAEVGEWAGRAVLGAKIGTAIAAAAPVTVRLVAPPEVAVSWPLELAYLDGRPLAARGDVTLVHDLGLPPAQGGEQAARALRMLAVFSMPTRTSVLALRRERYELTTLMRRIARQQRKVELAVVQYGATRDKLAAIAESGDGWDLLHLSGHGMAGMFLLEKADGSPDEITAAQLLGVLAPLRGRLKLAVVSACESGAAVTAQTLRLLGLADQAQALEHQASADQQAPGPGLAQELAGRLGCPVVGMRYPVTDGFAIAFAGELYERLLSRRDNQRTSQGQPLGIALAQSVRRAAGPAASPAEPALPEPTLSMATPVLLGNQQAAAMTIAVPVGAPNLDLALVRMERFPPEASRFVGRTAVMTKASSALSAGSNLSGVLLHGMAGSGKTACAVELAYRHQDSFTAAAFWKAPDTGDEFGTALADFATALDIQLDRYGFGMSPHITSTESLTRFAPVLRRQLAESGILLVLDNLESLLTPEGHWRDPKWEPLIAALTEHDGESRVVLTSRIPPLGLASRVLVQAVHALDLPESAALARELPNLAALMHADDPVRDGAVEEAVDADRMLVRRVLRVVQGHPKLMELADAAAADKPGLIARLDAAGATEAADQVLDTFFRDGTSALDATQFLDVLATWTITTLAALPEPARLMAQFIACLEDSDRTSEIIAATWPNLWRRLDRTDELPQTGPLLAALAASALVKPESLADSGIYLYHVHPGVAQAIRLASPASMQAAADAELAELWLAISVEASERAGAENSTMIVRAGLAATPYLLRQENWRAASVMIERVLHRDPSPPVVQTVLPALRAIAAATGEPQDLAILGSAIRPIDPAQAERLLREAGDRAAADARYRVAAAATTSLVNLLLDMGRLTEALAAVDLAAEYNRQAGLGRWTQLGDQAARLAVLAEMGQHREVLAQVMALRPELDRLSDTEAGNEAVYPWNVRENILDCGRSSAMALGQWQQALDLNAANLSSVQARGAGRHQAALARFNNYYPLLQLGRLEEAVQLLADCQQVFEELRDISRVAVVLGARAHVESLRDNLASAVSFMSTALRYGYLNPDPSALAGRHSNLASYLALTNGDRAAQRAHRLAGALLRLLMGSTRYLANTTDALTVEVRADPVGARLPATVADVVRVAEQTEGVRLGALLAAMESDPQVIERTLAEILAAARA